MCYLSTLFPRYFNEIALNPIDSPLSFSLLSMLDCPIDFAAATTLKWRGGVKENKDAPDQKNPAQCLNSFCTGL